MGKDLIERLRKRPSRLIARLLNSLCSDSANALEQMEWQPIETAPKDGTNILAYIPYGGGFVMQTHMRNDRCHPYWWVEAGEVDPSHWMPLPEPPK